MAAKSSQCSVWFSWDYLLKTNEGVMSFSHASNISLNVLEHKDLAMNALINYLI